MSRKEMMLMILALVWLALILIFLLRWMKSSPADVEVLAAATTIEANKPITPQNVAWKKIPANQVAPDDIKNEPRVLDRYLGKTIYTPVYEKQNLKTSFFAKPKSTSMSQLIKANLYAMTVPLSKNNDTNLFINPNDKVDVYLTRAQTSDNTTSQKADLSTQLLLSNIRVLAINNVSPLETVNPLKPPAQGPKTITLEVTPKQAQKLSLGASTGVLTFGLHAESDTKTTPIGVEPITGTSLNPPPSQVEYHGEKVIKR